MRISLLLQREPFGRILEETLSRFWSEQLGIRTAVQWHSGRPSRRVFSSGNQIWLVNYYINAIFATDAASDVFKPVRKEFSHSLVWWKRPLQKGYVALSSSQYGSFWLAQAWLTVIPAIDNTENLLIIPGNHKIRILDHRYEQVFSILKTGFSSHFMQQEIASRKLAADLHINVPPLTQVASNGTWFSEYYLIGVPLNRLTERAQVRMAEKKAATFLQRLICSTRQEESLHQYVSRLRSHILHLITKNHLLTGELKQNLRNDVEKITQHVLDSSPAIECNLTTSLSHGDFQPANILVDDDNVWLIDWEYSDRRQTGYDTLVFLLHSRFPRGLAQRLQTFVAEGMDENMPLFDILPIEWRSIRNRLLSARIFLLEELDLHLTENDNSQFFQLGAGLLQLHQEIEDWLDMEDAIGEKS